MKTLSLRTLAIVSGLACLNIYTLAQAESGDWNYPPTVKFDSTLSREEVRTEYLQAKKEGRLPTLGEGESSITAATFTSTLTREEVAAETRDWMRTQNNDVMMGGN